MNTKHIESQKISEQVQEFLAAGKPIQKIPNGVGKDNPFPTDSHRKAQKNGARAKRRKDSSRWHGPSDDSKSRRWNDGKQGVL